VGLWAANDNVPQGAIMTLFNKLPGFIRSPPGLECKVLRQLPSVFPVGLMVLLAPSVARFIAEHADSSAYSLALLGRLELAALSLLLPYCSFTVFVALSAFTVMVMKGPAYVADAYFMEEGDDRKGLWGPPRRRGW
jgi:hypothetical protein